MSSGGKLARCEVMFFAGSHGVGLARLENCISRMGMSLGIKSGWEHGPGRGCGWMRTYQGQGGCLHGGSCLHEDQ